MSTCTSCWHVTSSLGFQAAPSPTPLFVILEAALHVLFWGTVACCDWFTSHQTSCQVKAWTCVWLLAPLLRVAEAAAADCHATKNSFATDEWGCGFCNLIPPLVLFPHFLGNWCQCKYTMSRYCSLRSHLMEGRGSAALMAKLHTALKCPKLKWGRIYMCTYIYIYIHEVQSSIDTNKYFTVNVAHLLLFCKAVAGCFGTGRKRK